jgi:hypothetical protein
MLQRFIAITLLTCTPGLLTACGPTVQLNPANSSNQLHPSPDRSSSPETTLQLQFPTSPSAEMKTELKREKYQLRQGNRKTVGK